MMFTTLTDEKYVKSLSGLVHLMKPNGRTKCGATPWADLDAATEQQFEEHPCGGCVRVDRCEKQRKARVAR